MSCKSSEGRSEKPWEVSCPRCGESGFDGRGSWRVAGSHYYMMGCWNCGLEFLVEEEYKNEDT